MASKKESKDESSLAEFLKENKYYIGGVIAVGALAYYVIKSKNPSFSYQKIYDQSTPQDPNDKIKEINFIEEKKEDCTSCCGGSNKSNASSCNGIEYATPMDAFKNGKREKLLYTTATRTDNVTFDKDKGGDFVAVVDVDPSSNTYCQIIGQIDLGKGEEVHHSGWNACASCFGKSGFNRKYLVVPAFTSGNIHFIDTSNPTKPRLHKTVSGKMIKEKYGLSYPHTIHCLANGKIMISFLGVDPEHIENKLNSGADFLWFDENLEVEQRWVKDPNERPKYGYDYWYQPYHNIMISTEWGTPNAFSQGFNPQHIKEKLYGSSIHLWDWTTHKKVKTFEFSLDKVAMPLEIRFCHEPTSVHAICGAALTSNIIHIYKEDKGNKWEANPDYIQIEAVEMDNWALPNMPGLVTDVLISMDDKYLYFSNWLHGDIRQYDISDPFKPRLNSRCFCGGSLRLDGKFKIKTGTKLNQEPPIIPKVKGRRVEGGPQMLQLSLDGRRLYVTNSLYSAYDKQFYPDLVSNGGQMLMIDIDLDGDGKMSLNTDFMVDFGQCKGGPARPHEMRYPGGDCTSDIFVVQE